MDFMAHFTMRTGGHYITMLLMIGQYSHHMTLCPPVAIVKRCYGIRLYAPMLPQYNYSFNSSSLCQHMLRCFHTIIQLKHTLSKSQWLTDRLANRPVIYPCLCIHAAEELHEVESFPIFQKSLLPHE